MQARSNIGMQMGSGSHVTSGRSLWALTEDARVGGDPLTVHGRWGAVVVDDPRPPVREALRRMSLGPVALENIPLLRQEFAQWQRGPDGTFPAWRRIETTLARLGGYVVASLGAEDGRGPLLSATAVTADAVFTPPPVRASTVVGLRSDALLDERVLTCPGRPYQVQLHREVATAVVGALLAGAREVGDVAFAVGLAPPLVADIAAYLCGAGVAAREVVRTVR